MAEVVVVVVAVEVSVLVVVVAVCVAGGSSHCSGSDRGSGR